MKTADTVLFDSCLNKAASLSEEFRQVIRTRKTQSMGCTEELLGKVFSFIDYPWLRLAYKATGTMTFRSSMGKTEALPETVAYAKNKVGVGGQARVKALELKRGEGLIPFTLLPPKWRNSIIKSV